MNLVFFICFLVNFFFSTFLYCQENNKLFTLITTLKNESNKVRSSEYIKTIFSNSNNEFIKKILVVYEKLPGDNFFAELEKICNPKIEFHVLDHRPNLGEIFILANCLGDKEKIIIANADIEFDETLRCLSSYNFKNKLICLTRKDYSNGLWRLSTCGFRLRNYFYSASFDSWILETPIFYPKGSMDRFFLGKWGMEKFTNFFLRSGYKLLNPSEQINALHNHRSQIRYWSKHNDYDDLPDIYLPCTNLQKVLKPIISFECLVTD